MTNEELTAIEERANAATREPMICVDCGGSMTDDDLIAIAPGNGIVEYEHMNFSQCIASLNERIALATQRAEAAETERDAAIKRAKFAEADASKWLHDALIIAEGQRDQDRAERDALRDQWSDLLIEQARLMALRDEAVQQRDDAIIELSLANAQRGVLAKENMALGAERDALRTFVFVSGRWIKKYGTYNAVPTPEALEDFGELMEAYNALAVQP